MRDTLAQRPPWPHPRGTFERSKGIRDQIKTNLDQMDRILDELRDIGRESGDLSGRIAAERGARVPHSDVVAGKSKA